MLRRPFSYGLVIGSLALCATGFADVRAETLAGPVAPNAEPGTASEERTEGVLLLHSGGVLQGRVTAAGERYVVTSAKSEVNVAAAQVALVCASLDDAYEQQRRRLPANSAEGHLTLAEWCLRHDLVPQAERELIDARQCDAQAPRLALLERRLAVARQPRPSRPSGKGIASPDIKSSTDELRQIEAVADGLPAGAVEQFTRKIQPLLVNNCTSAGCHQHASGQEFRLDRALLHGLSNRRTTLRNLAATLALVDRDAPQRSPLLAIPHEEHGGRQQPLFGPKQDALHKQLVDWVALVTGSARGGAVVAAARDEQGAALTAAGPAELSKRPTALNVSDAANMDPELEATLVEPQPLRRGAELTPWRPKDTFDPEIFNRLPRNSAEASVDDAEERPATR
jgi:hypothetical protein